MAYSVLHIPTSSRILPQNQISCVSKAEYRLGKGLTIASEVEEKVPCETYPKWKDYLRHLPNICFFWYWRPSIQRLVFSCLDQVRSHLHKIGYSITMYCQCFLWPFLISNDPQVIIHPSQMTIHPSCVSSSASLVPPPLLGPLRRQLPTSPLCGRPRGPHGN